MLLTPLILSELDFLCNCTPLRGVPPCLTDMLLVLPAALRLCLAIKLDLRGSPDSGSESEKTVHRNYWVWKNTGKIFDEGITSQPKLLWAPWNLPLPKMVWEWPPGPKGLGSLSFENIPRFGPEIGTLSTPGGSHGAKFFLHKFSHTKMFRFV